MTRILPEEATKNEKGESVELEGLDCHKQSAQACPFNAIPLIWKQMKKIFKILIYYV